MISRRDVVKLGLAAPGLAAIPVTARAATAAMPQGLDLLLLDERFTAALSATSATETLRFSGDVTRLWVDRLDAAFRQRGFVLGGITGSDALFVLEVLANHHGRRVVSRTDLAARDERGVAPVSWVIAPHHPSVVMA